MCFAAYLLTFAMSERDKSLVSYASKAKADSYYSDMTTLRSLIVNKLWNRVHGGKVVEHVPLIDWETLRDLLHRFRIYEQILQDRYESEELLTKQTSPVHFLRILMSQWDHWDMTLDEERHESDSDDDGGSAFNFELDGGFFVFDAPRLANLKSALLRHRIQSDRKVLQDFIADTSMAEEPEDNNSVHCDDDVMEEPKVVVPEGNEPMELASGAQEDIATKEILRMVAQTLPQGSDEEERFLKATKRFNKGLVAAEEFVRDVRAMLTDRVAEDVFPEMASLLASRDQMDLHDQLVRAIGACDANYAAEWRAGDH